MNIFKHVKICFKYNLHYIRHYIILNLNIKNLNNSTKTYYNYPCIFGKFKYFYFQRVIYISCNFVLIRITNKYVIYDTKNSIFKQLK